MLFRSPRGRLTRSPRPVAVLNRASFGKACPWACVLDRVRSLAGCGWAAAYPYVTVLAGFADAPALFALRAFDNITLGLVISSYRCMTEEIHWPHRVNCRSFSPVPSAAPSNRRFLRCVITRPLLISCRTRCSGSRKSTAIGHRLNFRCCSSGFCRTPYATTFADRRCARCGRRSSVLCPVAVRARKIGIR